MKAKTKRIIGKSGLILVALGILWAVTQLTGSIVCAIVLLACAAFVCLIVWLVSLMETED